MLYCLSSMGVCGLGSMKLITVDIVNIVNVVNIDSPFSLHTPFAFIL